ncbi:MAG: YlxM family DNA-binding protein [Thermotaleaceae bacterium]
MFNKMLQISLLYDFYGQLLTEKQQEVVQLYYNHDYSLGEISQELHVSRQAVYDTIKRTEKVLFEYEQKLGLVDKFISTQQDVEKALDIVRGIEHNIDKPEILIEDFKDQINRIKAILIDILEK